MRRRATPTLLALLAATALVRCSSSTSSPSAAAPGETTPPNTPGEDAASEAASVDAGSEASCSTNLSSDPKNCGRCGHDCLGGSCIDGLCQPVVLASDRAGPGSVAIDATHVYWTESSVLMLLRVPKAGGAVEVLDRAVGNVYAGHLHVDDTRAYWSDNTQFANSIQNRRVSASKVPDAGARLNYGAVTTYSAIGSFPWVSGVVLDGDDVLFTTGGGVAREPKDAGALPKAVTNTSFFLTSLAADMGALYVGSIDGQILRGALDGGATTPIASGQGDVEELLVDGADLFWISADLGSISIAKNKASAEVFAAGLDSPRGIAVDATSVYWTEKDAVRSCPRSGCGAGPRVIAKLQARPTGIALDDTSLYWANGVGGTIVRLAK